MTHFDKEFSRSRRAKLRRTVRWLLLQDTLCITGRSRGFCALLLDIQFRGSGWLGWAARLNFVLKREQNSDSVWRSREERFAVAKWISRSISMYSAPGTTHTTDRLCSLGNIATYR